jgi:NAD(P)-dependent dehydrogenase (short-subunit alcohol dehydrogenase family)
VRLDGKVAVVTGGGSGIGVRVNAIAPGFIEAPMVAASMT